MFHTKQTLSMGATGVTPWVDCRRLSALSTQTNCGDVNDPVGVVTMEVTNDVATVEKEQANGTTPANSAAVLATFSITTTGDAWSNGYNGVGAKASISTAAGTVGAAFARIRYTRTTGGAGDTLTIHWAGKVGY